MKITVKTESGSYDITLKRNALKEVETILNIKGKEETPLEWGGKLELFCLMTISAVLSYSSHLVTV